MSELTPCNYCSLERLKKAHQKEGQYLLLESPQNIGMLEVFVVTVDRYGKELGRRWVSSFSALSTTCVC